MGKINQQEDEMSRTPSIQQFTGWAKAHHDQARLVCAAQAFAILERKRVDAYITPIFESFGFQYCGELAEKTSTTGPVPSVNELYLCEDPRLADFDAACERAHREHGFTGETGCCPALVAENLQLQAEQALIQEGAALFGLDDCAITLDLRAEFLRHLMGACLKGAA